MTLTAQYQVKTRTRALLLAPLALYLLLVVPTVGRQGVNWDEQTDLEIVSVYTRSLGDAFYGTRDDAVNTRLPMYLTAALFALTESESVTLARLLSCAMGLLAIVAVYAYGVQALDHLKGLVAAVILATSPYFLYFSKQALSEGDVFITAAVAWVLVAYAGYRNAPSLGRGAGLGLALGLALSMKISAAAVVPAVAILLLVEGEPGDPTVKTGPLWALLAAFAGWVAITAVVVSRVFNDWSRPLSSLESLAVPRLLGALALAAVLGGWLVAHRRSLPTRPRVLVAVALLALLTFFIVPPVHTTNPWVLGALWETFFASGSGLTWSVLAEHGVFHFLVLLLKPGPLVGLGLWLALAVALARVRKRPELRLPLLVFVLYGTFVLLLPWAQTRYMMPLFVVLAILAADAFVDLYRSRRRTAMAVAALAAASLAADLGSSWPDPNLNGYPLVGERYLLGRATVGYRSLVHAPSDGIEQALRWVGGRASAGETVMVVLAEVHILDAVLPDPPFDVVNPVREPVTLSQADWVVTSINGDLRPMQDGLPHAGIYRYPHYDREQLERDFARVFSVKRAFDLEVAAVWQRRERPGS